MQASRWTIITVTYNSAETLAKFWSSATFPPEVDWIVVDNASVDDTVEVATKLGAKVIAMAKNAGFGAANNTGLDLAKSEYIAFVNPDVTPIFADLDLLADRLSKSPGLYAPQLTNPDGSLQPNGRADPYLWYKIGNRLASQNVKEDYFLYAGQGVVRQVSWLMGAVVCGRREDLYRLGPWDDKFFLYYEDSDLGLRASKLGLPSYVVGDSNWVHGWARETTRIKWGPWKREAASMLRFYSRYPRLLSPSPAMKRNGSGQR